MNDFSLANDYEQGIPVSELAVAHNTTPQTIYRRLRRLGSSIRKPYAKNKIILTPEQKSNILTEYNFGHNREEIAAKVGTTVHAVRQVLRGNTRTTAETADIVTERHRHHLSDSQYQCIIGSLLGDASISVRRNTYAITMSHCDRQREYIEHKRALLGGSKLVSYIRDNESYAPGKICHQFAYQNKGALKPIADLVWKNGRKTVSEDWMDRLAIQGVAYWFMDDGSSTFVRSKIGSSFVRFATMGFPKPEVELLANKLRQFGFDATTRKNQYGHKWYIRLSTKSSQDFYRAVSAYIIPPMRYKLKPSESADEYYVEHKFNPSL